MSFNDKVVYQIYPKSFLDTSGNGIGDINGIIAKLDYIKQLGVDYIWLCPVNCSPQADNGYDISDYYNIDPLFGTLEDYKRLIAKSKKLGMKVMLDLVLNHTSDEHEWFQRALKGEQEYMDYYIWADEPNDIQGFFSSSSWQYVESLDQYYLHLFDKGQPDLNWHNPEVRHQLYKAINFWIELGVEGFRLDVIDLIAKEPEKLITGKGPKFHEYLEELNTHTFGDKLLTVGECWNSTILEANKICHEKAMSEIFHFSHLILTNGADKWDQKKVDYNQVINEIWKWQNEYEGNQTIVMNNHDMPRLISVWLDDKEYRYQSATLLATLFTLLNGTQYIYQGEEIGMINGYMDDIADYVDVETLGIYEQLQSTGISKQEIIEKIKLISRDNARIPMSWNDEQFGGFSTASPWIKEHRDYKQVNVAADLQAKQSVYKFYQELIKFKKDNYKQIIDHKLEEITYKNGVISYQKQGMIVACNMHDQVVEYEASGKIVFNNYDSFDQTLKPYQTLVTINRAHN